MRQITEQYRNLMAERGMHDATCEVCGKALFRDLGDEWSECKAPDGDGWTSFTICEPCIEAAEQEAQVA